MNIRFDWVRDEKGLDDLREPWEALAGDRLGPFRSWSWQSRWWRHLGKARGRRLAVLVAREGEEIRGILPLYTASRLPGGRKRLGLLSDTIVGSDYLGLVADPAVAKRGLGRLVAERLAEEVAAGLADHVDLLDLDEADPFAAHVLESLAGSLHTVAREARYTCPYANLSGTTHEDWLAARPNGFGSQLAQRRRRLEREPGFDLRVLASPADVDGSLDALFELHRARWVGEGGSQAFPSVRVERFHHDVARDFARRGWARLAMLHVRGRPVAAGYGFSVGDTFWYYQAGHAPDWRARSVGTVVLGQLIEVAFAEGLSRFDFLRGDEPYKAIWADSRNTTLAVRGHRGGAMDRAAESLNRWERKARRALSRGLPAPAAAALRSWLF
jgi:CelD/BcsL family acetyltransferase involved in cellulose biosynthesis